MDNYEDIMGRVRRGEIQLAVSCYDAKINRSSRDARELPGLFPDFEKIFLDSIRRLS